MHQIKSIANVKLIIIVLSLDGIRCSIDGTFSNRRPNDTKTGDDPCNPLYWYPREIPEYCYFKNAPTPPSSGSGPDMPIPVPIPVPIPPPMPVPMPLIPPPVVPPIIMPPHAMPPGPPPPVPHPIVPLPMPLPFGIPLAPTNPMVPVAGIPLSPPAPIPYPMPYPQQFPNSYQPAFPQQYPSPFPAPYPAPYSPPLPSPYASPYPIPPRNRIGLVPGIPGLVSHDGGINIMPFSDAYSDMLEKHKQKMIRRKLQKMMSQYDRHPWKSRRKTRRHNSKIDEDLEDIKLDDNTIEE